MKISRSSEFQMSYFRKALTLLWSSTIRGEQDLQPHLDVRTLSAPPKDGGGRGGELKRELKWSAIYVIALVLKHYQPITSFLVVEKRLPVYN